MNLEKRLTEAAKRVADLERQLAEYQRMGDAYATCINERYEAQGKLAEVQGLRDVLKGLDTRPGVVMSRAITSEVIRRLDRILSKEKE